MMTWNGLAKGSYHIYAQSHSKYFFLVYPTLTQLNTVSIQNLARDMTLKIQIARTVLPLILLLL